jgi:hypothetical protein
MKKIIFFSLFAACTMMAAAQTLSSIKWNVNAGIGLSNYYGKNTDGTDPKFAYRVGVGMELPFDQTWSLQSGLNFVSKGSKAGDDIVVKTNALYLELPIMAGLRMPTASGFDVLLKAGPYIACGVGGKAKATIGNEKYKENTFSSDGWLKRFDAGLGFGVGFEFSKYVVGLDTQLGLVNASKKEFKDAGYKPKNLTAFLTFGYKF